MTEKDGKATGWKAFYHNGKWQEEQAKSRASSPRKKAASPRKKK
jgi:DNA topoisomerase-1